MTVASLQRIADLLSEVGAPGSFSAKQARPTEDLHLEVKGLGRLRFPVPRRQAQRLCQIGRPARYGLGEKTLLDRQVRDTWEIPKSRVKIDLRRWKRTLLPVLAQLGEDLGVAAGHRLKAEFHAMLVYAPGQFFLPHQDSEKADKMVGTLVVTLPSSFKGGTLRIEHQDESATYRGSRKHLSFVAFYADCQHEVRPVKEGYRITLTYNLMLEKEPTAAEPEGVEANPALVEALVELLREHFETPLPPRWRGKQEEPLRKPPNRLVYLLDHQYTQRGLSWQRLKGSDATRSAALVAAAERYDCERVLALAEVQETWHCMDSDWSDHIYGHHRSWWRDEDDEWYEDDPPAADDPDRYELLDLIDQGIHLTRCINSSGKRAAAIVRRVDDEEVCATTPSSSLDAYASEYEGYMGNWGNTMDRWYRRAAIVLWPRQRAFVVRAEASPVWALGQIGQKVRSGRLSEAQKFTASLLPFWDAVVRHETRGDFLDRALPIAEGLEEPALAASLLLPFSAEALTPAQAPTFVALVRSYGEDWARSLLAGWASHRPESPQDSFAWLGSLPRLCKALCATEPAGRRCAKLLWRDQWAWLKGGIDQSVHLTAPSRQDPAIAALAKPILGLLKSTEVIGVKALQTEMVTFLRTRDHEPLLPALVSMLRVAARGKAARKGASPALNTLRRHCIRQLEARLKQPTRKKDDWSLDLPGTCDCDLCITLRDFLADPKKKQLEWPIAKRRRLHVHREIDRYELPVLHKTRRTGSPFTLVLHKKTTLFEHEAKARRNWRRDLEWLTKPRKSA